MPLLDPISLKQALSVMGEAVGLSPITDKPEIISFINKYRNTLFTRYSEFHIFDNAFHNIKVTHFGTYHGFTLPEDIVSVEAVWDYGRPLTLHSRWRESHTGIGIDSYVRVGVSEMAEMFPTERDLITNSAIKIFCEREEDEGKCVHVELLNVAGKVISRTFKLISDGWAVDGVVATKIISVVLPDNMVGSVTIAQRTDGFVLSQYKPWETIPSYRRFKIAENTCRKTVLVQGVKRFKRIYLDHDIVEVGDALVIEAAGQYFKFGDNTTDANQLSVANMWFDKMRVLLNGLIARHRGYSIQDGSTPIRAIRKKSLPGYK